MESDQPSTEQRVQTGALRLDACIVLASTTMSPEDVEKARRSGALLMAAPKRGTAYLEVGGIVVAEGRMARRGGTNAFVVTRTYRENGEAL